MRGNMGKFPFNIFKNITQVEVEKSLNGSNYFNIKSVYNNILRNSNITLAFCALIVSNAFHIQSSAFIRDIPYRNFYPREIRLKRIWLLNSIFQNYIFFYIH